MLILSYSYGIYILFNKFWIKYLISSKSILVSSLLKSSITPFPPNNKSTKLNVTDLSINRVRFSTIGQILYSTTKLLLSIFSISSPYET